jgi:prepilin-type N-terminal cleavage/methylation domain-containing protein
MSNFFKRQKDEKVRVLPAGKQGLPADRQAIGKQGFTLLETLVTIVIISIGVLGSINLINNSFGLATIAKNKLIAADLAQEGFELVRNIRDVNYLKNLDWLQGLDLCLAPNWCLIDSSSLESPFIYPSGAANPDNQMCYSSAAGYYSRPNCSMSTNNLVDFKRIIQITPIGSALNGGAKVIVRVSWKEKGVWKDFGTNGSNFEYHLCDWKNANSNSSCY